MNITTSTTNNNNNMLAKHMANSHHMTSRGMVKPHPRTVNMVEAFPTALPTQQCVDKMVESSNKATHTQKFEIPTDEICPEQLLATHVNTWMATADEFISIATGLLTSWQVTELSTKARFNILMRSGFATRHFKSFSCTGLMNTALSAMHQKMPSAADTRHTAAPCGSSITQRIRSFGCMLS